MAPVVKQDRQERKSELEQQITHLKKRERNKNSLFCHQGHMLAAASRLVVLVAIQFIQLKKSNASFFALLINGFFLHSTL